MTPREKVILETMEKHTSLGYSSVSRRVACFCGWAKSCSYCDKLPYIHRAHVASEIEKALEGIDAIKKG